MNASNPNNAGLASKIYLEQAAVENWARFSNGPEDLPQMRAQLILAIDQNGKLSTDLPEWMTQDKPGVDIWVHLPGKISLELAKEETHHFRYRAKNAVAPKSIRKQARPPMPAKKPGISKQLLEETLQASAEELKAMVHFSIHCFQQLKERTGLQATEEELQAALLSSGRVQAPPPTWADASGKSTAVLLLSFGNKDLALPLVENAYQQKTKEKLYGNGLPLIATTTIPRDWSESGLWRLKGQALSEAIHISSTAAREFGESQKSSQSPEELKKMIKLVIASNSQTVCGSVGEAPHLPLLQGKLLLRAANAEQRRQHDKSWIATSYQKTDA